MNNWWFLSKLAHIVNRDANRFGDRRPLVIFAGNCQAQHLAAIFNGTGLVDAHVIGEDVGFVATYRKKLPSFVDEKTAHHLVRDAKAAGRRVIQVIQITQLAAPPSVPYLDLIDEVVTFPYIEFYASLPEAFALRFGARQPLRRVFRLDISTIEHCQKQCDIDVDIARFVRETAPHRPLFNSPTHPVGLILSLLFAGVARRIGTIPAAHIAAVQTDLSESEGINFESAYTVPDDVLRELGFAWPDWYGDYRQMVLDGNAGRHDEILRNRRRNERRFSNDTLFWRFLSEAAIAKGHDRVAGRATKRLTEICPGLGHYWSMRYGVWQKRGNQRQMAKTVAEARAIYGEHRQFNSIMAAFELRSGRYDNAVAQARLFSAKTVSRSGGPVIIVAFMVWSGRSQEARDEAERQAAAMSEEDRKDFIHRLKEYGVDLDEP